MQKSIHYFNQSIVFIFRDKNAIRSWLLQLITKEGYQPGNINFIFCNDKYLNKINLQYLQHSDYTDIITFDNSTVKGTIESDIFISVQRVKANAKKLNVTFRDELHRVMAHGVLHLCGYKDKAPVDKRIMTAREDLYLSLRSF